MHGYVTRLIEKDFRRAHNRSPVVCVFGPRQSGKSTTAKMFLNENASLYLDLQNRVDRSKLTEPELFFDRYGVFAPET